MKGKRHIHIVMADQGEQGPRARRLKQLLNKSMDSSIRSASLEKANQCFPTLLQKAPEKLKSAHSQVIKYLQHSTEKEFDKIISEKDITHKLNSLDQITNEARKRASNPELENSEIPSILGPLKVISSHIYMAKSDFALDLESKVENLKLSNIESLDELISSINILENEFNVLLKKTSQLEQTERVSESKDLQSIDKLIRSTPSYNLD